MTALGVLCCFALFVCLTLLASFFLPSHLSFKNMYIYTYNTHTHNTDTDCMMQWLLSLGIAEEMATSYHNQFCSQFIDQRTLREMCRDDLNALGVSALGHRVLINSAAKKGRCVYLGACSLYSCDVKAVCSA